MFIWEMFWGWFGSGGKEVFTSLPNPVQTLYTILVAQSCFTVPHAETDYTVPHARSNY